MHRAIEVKWHATTGNHFCVCAVHCKMYNTECYYTVKVRNDKNLQTNTNLCDSWADQNTIEWRLHFIFASKFRIFTNSAIYDRAYYFNCIHFWGAMLWNSIGWTLLIEVNRGILGNSGNAFCITNSWKHSKPLFCTFPALSDSCTQT